MFKYIFLFLMILALVPPVRRFLFWLIVGRQIIKEQKRYAPDNRKKTKEGDVNIEFTPPQNKSDFKGGQYVDYEEVKE